ncbi:MAG: DUF4124 domain-containing protein [Rudaea sp.]
MLEFNFPGVARWLCASSSVALLIVAVCVNAETVYKCIDGDGGIAFQAQPCAATQQQSTVALAQAPAYAASPTYAVDAKRANKRHKTTRSRTPALKEFSFECRSSDGQVFYRHRGCPHRVAGSDNARKQVGVSATKISREYACAQIHRAGAIGRPGHKHDETVSAYDHNLGRDPCD